jgi:hypothetical protein
MIPTAENMRNRGCSPWTSGTALARKPVGDQRDDGENDELPRANGSSWGNLECDRDFDEQYELTECSKGGGS